MKYPSYIIPQSKKLQSALFWYHLLKCTCDSGSREPGPHHREHCEMHTPF